MTVDDFSVGWFATGTRKWRTELSYRGSYARDIRPRLGDKVMETLTPAEIMDAMGAIKGPASRARAFSILSQMYSLAVVRRSVPTNPCTGLAKWLNLGKTSEPAKKAISSDQFSHLLGVAMQMAASDRLRYAYPVAFAVGGLAGLRPGETLALRWDDYDGASLRVDQTWGPRECGTTKTGKVRMVDVTPALARLLDAYKAIGYSAAPWVFAAKPHETSKPLTISSLQKALKRVLKEAGLPLSFSPHGARHTFCSVQIAKGESVRYVQEQAGHADIKMTMHYGSGLRAQSVLPAEQRGVL